MQASFCDPHGLWQRPPKKNLNGLLRQYLAKGIDLSIDSQKDLDRIPHSLNKRPRANLALHTPAVSNLKCTTDL
jgi:IS30 family transposase